jgi:hypothetical protein
MLFINYAVYRIERLLGRIIDPDHATQVGAGIVILTNFNALMTIDIVLFRVFKVDLIEFLDHSFKGTSIGIAIILVLIHIMLLLFFKRPEHARIKYSKESKGKRLAGTIFLTLYLLINPAFVILAIYL